MELAESHEEYNISWPPNLFQEYMNHAVEETKDAPLSLVREAEGGSERTEARDS